MPRPVQAASQTAGVFAAASVRTETKPGPLDLLSRQLARTGQLPAHRRRPHGVHGPGMRAVARMLWSTQSPVTSDLALMQALSECLLTVGDMLAASDRAHAAQVIAGNARTALTEVHMRLDWLDPAKRYVRDHRSPMWAAEQRARAIVDRVGETSRGELETEIALAHDGWKARRIAQAGAGKGPRIDARGQILDIPAAPAKSTRRRAGADRLAWLDQEIGFAPAEAAESKQAKPAPRQTPGSEHDKHSGLGLPHLPPSTDQDRDFER